MKEKPRKTHHWTNEEDSSLRELYPNNLNKDIARKLNKSVSGVEKKASLLGLTKSKEFRKEINRRNAGSSERCRVWTEEEIKYLVDSYKSLTGREIAKNLGRSYPSVIYKAQSLGLKKNKKRRARKVKS